MQSVQTIGIDLPLKVLVWQDASGTTWLSYNDPNWLAKRHGLGHEADATVKAMATALCDREDGNFTIMTFAEGAPQRPGNLARGCHCGSPGRPYSSLT